MIDKDKTYKTRDGREVRIYATDGGGAYPIHAAYWGDENWVIMNWTENGKPSCYNDDENGIDLIEVKPRIKRTVYLNVYNTEHPTEIEYGNYPTKDMANIHAFTHRIACIKVEIDCEEGEGLND